MADKKFTRIQYAKYILSINGSNVKSSGAATFRHTTSDTTDGQSTTSQQPMKVGILGEGMAGLYAGLLLQSLGIDYEILEANPDRVGGRVFTYRFNGKAGKDTKPGTPEYNDYFDVGAMRFPMIPMMERLVGQQPWSLVNYLNVNAQKKIEMVPYNIRDNSAFLYFNGIKVSIDEANKNKNDDTFHVGKKNGGTVLDEYAAKPTSDWASKAFDELAKQLNGNIPDGFKLLNQIDTYTRTYLQQTCSYPPELIDWMETREASTGSYDMALTEMIIDLVEFNTTQWQCVDGGSDRLVDAILSLLKDQPKLGCEVIKISPQGTAEIPSGVEVIAKEMGTNKSRLYSHVISTLPLGVLRGIDTDDCQFSYGKKTALRMLAYGTAVKVGLRFKTRFWQNGPSPIVGGSSFCDTPPRMIVYPSYGLDCKDAPGILMASYAHHQDADRLGAMSELEVVDVCLDTLEKLHGHVVRKEYTGQYFVYDWYHDRYAQGAFATFGPGQFKTHYPYLLEPALTGLLHFAGEAASANHAWIVGALDSAYRSVWQILNRQNDPIKKKELIDKWGIYDEIDYGDLTDYAKSKWPNFNMNAMKKGRNQATKKGIKKK